MTNVLTKKRKSGHRDTAQGKSHVRTKAEIRVVLVQAKDNSKTTEK